MDKLIVCMDLAIVIIGIYMAYLAVRMHRTKEVGSLILTEEEKKKCRKPEKFAEYVSPRMFGFSCILIVVGALRVLCDTVISIGNWSFLVLVVFLAAFFWFLEQIRKAKDLFC